MGNPKAFLTVPRQEAGYRPIHDRIRDFGEVEQTLNTSERRLQASRCNQYGENQFSHIVNNFLRSYIKKSCGGDLKGSLKVGFYSFSFRKRFTAENKRCNL